MHAVLDCARSGECSEEQGRPEWLAQRQELETARRQKDKRRRFKDGRKNRIKKETDWLRPNMTPHATYRYWATDKNNRKLRRTPKSIKKKNKKNSFILREKRRLKRNMIAAYKLLGKKWG